MKERPEKSVKLYSRRDLLFIIIKNIRRRIIKCLTYCCSVCLNHLFVFFKALLCALLLLCVLPILVILFLYTMAWLLSLTPWLSDDPFNYIPTRRIGPRYPATQGEVWPKSWQERKTQNVYQVDPLKLAFKIIDKNCPKIDIAIQRCKDYIFKLKRYLRVNETVMHNLDCMIQELQIDLSLNCEDVPYFGMNESYNLEVSSRSVLRSSSVWGIIRGMETFSQLFYLTIDFKYILINGTSIDDRPQYLHRGLMLDTARHYLHVKTILKTLDAMAMNKMNVFHWHIGDDESFPFQSIHLPKFSNAVYDPSMIYTKNDVEKIKNHASNLGIRVMIEIDIPGHIHSWELAYPEVLTECKGNGNYSRPLHPVKNETYVLLKKLLNEIQELMSDNFFHVGGNQVHMTCYLKDPDVQKYMKQHHICSENVIQALFFKNAFPLLQEGTIPVVWEDVFNSIPLPKDVIVQTRRRIECGLHSMFILLKAGHRGIESAPYNLNYLHGDFAYFYNHEPRLAIKEQFGNDTLLKNLIGGTACMWGEMVDDNNVLSRVWPRASAVSEVLWSETAGFPPDDETLRRIEEHTCRMVRRGIPAEPPAGPGFCRVLS